MDLEGLTFQQPEELRGLALVERRRNQEGGLHSLGQSEQYQHSYQVSKPGAKTTCPAETRVGVPGRLWTGRIWEKSGSKRGQGRSQSLWMPSAILDDSAPLPSQLIFLPFYPSGNWLTSLPTHQWKKE